MNVRLLILPPALGGLIVWGVLQRDKTGDTVRLRVFGYGDKTFPSEIEQINRRAEFTPRNVQTMDERAKQVFGIKLRIPPTPELRPGMSAEVTFAATK